MWRRTQAIRRINVLLGLRDASGEIGNRVIANSKLYARSRFRGGGQPIGQPVPVAVVHDGKNGSSDENDDCSALASDPDSVMTVPSDVRSHSEADFSCKAHCLPGRHGRDS